ncbi:MAG TPA: hypothetical protein VI172_14905 [Candidatus Dormibacteraeota bacterium]
MTFTGTLSNLHPMAGGDIAATITHSELALGVVFPAGLCDTRPDLIADGVRVTVEGDDSGQSIRATAVTAAV